MNHPGICTAYGYVYLNIFSLPKLSCSYIAIFLNLWICCFGKLSMENLEKATAPYSSTLAWEIPWTEEPGMLQSMGSWRVRHSWATSLSLFTFMHFLRNDNPLQCSCLENPRDRGAWCSAVCGVTQSRTRLKRLSSSSNSSNGKLNAWIWHQK